MWPRGGMGPGSGRGSNWRDEYNLARLQRSQQSSGLGAGPGGAPGGTSVCESGIVDELFAVLQDLVDEQEGFRSTIEHKLDELDTLEQLINQLEQGYH